MSLETIKKKVYAGERLTQEDAVTLYKSNDIFAIGELADWKNKQINGDRVYFNINRHINPTNVCVFSKSCTFCSYSDSVKDPRSYTMEMEEILKEAEGMEAEGAKELHIVGGLHPHKDFEWYVDIIRQLKKRHPDVHLKSWTAVEIDYFSRITKKSYSEVFDIMIEAGMGSMPGGGAEIFAEHLRKKIASKKVSSENWIEVHRTAHQKGLNTNATMLYGHIENIEDRVDHMNRLRELQDETGGFNAFIPLAYHPEDNELEIDTFTAGLEDLKVYAIARLFLDNFKHIKAYWIMITEKLAQVALNFGVNDIDGTVVTERIYHAAGAQTPQKISVEDLVHLIDAAGKIPVERDTIYNEIKRWSSKTA
jgi:aminodeoxyfutalosine synthase